MTPRGRNYVTYMRVSTQRQGRSGLGLDAQRQAVNAFLAAHCGAEVATYTEVESGSGSDRPQLQAALKRCKQTRATLLVAKLDRLSRNASFLLTLRDAGTKFVAADLPDANELTVGVLAVVAQHEREMISRRTKEALAAAKARGVKLGGPLRPGTRRTARNAMEANRAAADARAEELRDVLMQIGPDESLRHIAAELARMAIPTSRGSATWTRTGVARLLDRLELR